MASAARSLSKTLPSIPQRARRIPNSLPKSCHQVRNSSVRQRGPEDPLPPSPTIRPPPGMASATPGRHGDEARTKPQKLWPAKLSIVAGSIFIGILIYDMYNNPIAPEQTEAPSVADLDSRRKRESGVTDTSPMRLRMEAYIKEQQDIIVRELEKIDGGKFRKDSWLRPAGGEGMSCVLQDGEVFEKAGVNTSIVYGTLPRSAIAKMRVNHKALDPDIESLEFFAAGLSMVLHPQNPMAPTVHLNYRYFETMDKNGEGKAWWFGGGTDLTPSYLFEEDTIHFHKSIKDACDKHDRSYYPRFKAWCDKYFYIPHRGESRGVGGIFFDDLDEEEKDQEELFSFVKHCLESFLPAYVPIILKRKDMPFGPREKQWQQVRRGRYAEFNLVYDRGTSFGLNTPGARVESILMSLPLTASWRYMHEPERGSREERMLGVLKKPVEWV